MIRGEGIRLGLPWTELLAKDYCDPRYHISSARAIGRRLRRTYAWIFVIQVVSYYGKLAIHPTPIATLADRWERAAIGLIPGGLVARKAKRREWTAGDVRDLKSLAKKRTPAGRIAKSLKRTIGATRQKAFSLGISLDSRG
jgi:hypothetical protein